MVEGPAAPDTPAATPPAAAPMQLNRLHQLPALPLAVLHTPQRLYAPPGPLAYAHHPFVASHCMHWLSFPPSPHLAPRWTIQALADKFQIRRQRVLAILAHKEMEAAALEQGTLLRGPLRPFAYTIPLEDLALDPVTGEPLDLAQLVEAEQQQRQEGGSSVPSSSSQVGGKGWLGGWVGGGGAATPAAAQRAARWLGRDGWVERDGWRKNSSSGRHHRVDTTPAAARWHVSCGL